MRHAAAMYRVYQKRQTRVHRKTDGRCNSNGCPLEKVPYTLLFVELKSTAIETNDRARSLQYNFLFPRHLFLGTLFPFTRSLSDSVTKGQEGT
jgi:hypothetical protein